MKRLTLLILLAVAITPASARERKLRLSANPSAVIARELEYAQAAQDRGQWTAFRDFAAADAVMFTPAMVYAQDWLKNRTNPAISVKWQPTEVWSSCDGSLVVSHGAWQGPKGNGYFTTIWRREKNGDYKWVLDSGDTLKEPLAVPELIPAHVADCPARRGPRVEPRKAVKTPLDPAQRSGASDDGTLTWAVTVTPDGARNFSAQWAKDGIMSQMLVEQVAAE